MGGVERKVLPGAAVGVNMKIMATATWLVMGLAVIVVAVLMCRQSGMIPGLDFGCGQYYYTDIPNWTKYFSVAGVIEHTPRWVYYLLFAGWGYFMYWLWTKI